MRVIDVLDLQQQGPGQVANAVRSSSEVADKLSQFKQSGSSITYGNLLTVPVGDELMYVEPIYASLSTATAATFPILRYVLVSYRGEVGIGTTLTRRSTSPARVPTTPPTTPRTTRPTTRRTTRPTTRRTRRHDTPTGTVDQQIRALLDQAQEEFELADQAYADGDLGEYQDHIQEAQRLVEQAVALSNGSGSPGSPSPSGTSPSASRPRPDLSH